ncbi:MAG: YaeQ family protein [Desulfuromonadaceae bacterium]|nr:YaeQ family protein [Desulfuromonadaceae bacterium]MDD2855319.1 YaeQ family protein [Desulfuromonadaceae bacterium]
MALPSTIYRTNIQLSDVDRAVYETLSATVARHPSETEERLVTRLLAYSLFYEPELSFTKGICAVDEPDLWLKGPDDRVLIWVEVGLPESDRIVKASRHTERIVLVACGKTYMSWEQQHLQKLMRVPNLTLISFDQQFISSLVSVLQRSIDWEITVTDGNIYINAGGETFETPLKVLVGRR